MRHNDLIESIAKHLADSNGFQRAVTNREPSREGSGVQLPKERAQPAKARSVASDIENFFGDGNFDVWPTPTVADEGHRATASPQSVRRTVPTFQEPQPGTVAVAVSDSDYSLLVATARERGVHPDVLLEQRILAQRATPFVPEVDFSTARSRTFALGEEATSRLFSLARQGVTIHDVVRGLLATQTVATATERTDATELDAIKRFSQPANFPGPERSYGA